MPVVINGTTGVSGVDGSASTPALQGSDTNTGVFFGADIIAFSEGGAECARFNADSQFVAAAGTASLPVLTTTGDLNTGIFFPAADTIGFAEGGAEAMRINSSGALQVGSTTVTGGAARIQSTFNGAAINGIDVRTTYTTDTSYMISFFNNANSSVGSITYNLSSIAYNTSSDYRLKENIVPMTGALSVVQSLKPCTYTWKADGSTGQGFIAHELAEVCPDCVTGEKDAVDADGNPKYQGVDTSFLVATLTAAIQELNAKVETLEAQNAAFEARLAALEAK